MTFRMIVQLWNTNTPAFVSCDADQTENYMYISMKFGTGVHVFCWEVGVFNRSSFQSVSCKCFTKTDRISAKYRSVRIWKEFYQEQMMQCTLKWLTIPVLTSVLGSYLQQIIMQRKLPSFSSYPVCVHKNLRFLSKGIENDAHLQWRQHEQWP